MVGLVGIIFWMSKIGIRRDCQRSRHGWYVSGSVVCCAAPQYVCCCLGSLAGVERLEQRALLPSEMMFELVKSHPAVPVEPLGGASCFAALKTSTASDNLALEYL